MEETMLCWIKRCFILQFFICSLFSVYPHDSLAKTEYDLKQKAFLNFEDKINAMVFLNAKQLDMLDKLDKLNEQMDKKDLYNIVVSTRRTFSETSNTFTKLEIPSILPKNIKESLKTTKSDFSYGFKALEESMTYYAKYLDTEDPVLYWKSVKKRERGITHINGGFTSLTTVRIQLILPEYKEISNASWEVIKLYLFKLQRA